MYGRIFTRFLHYEILKRYLIIAANNTNQTITKTIL